MGLKKKQILKVSGEQNKVKKLCSTLSLYNFLLQSIFSNQKIYPKIKFDLYAIDQKEHMGTNIHFLSTKNT